jgi:hypothetical protein
MTKDDTDPNAAMAGTSVFSVLRDGQWTPVEPGEACETGGETARLRAGFGAEQPFAEGFTIAASEDPHVLAVRPAREKTDVPVDGKKRIVLRWDPVDPDVTYNVYRGTDGDADVLCASGLTGTFYTDEDVVPGKSYCYRITACRDTGEAWEETEEEQPEEEAAEEEPEEAGVLSRRYPEIANWREYVYFKPERRGAYNYDINPVFLRRLAALSRAYLKEKLFVTWGYRTREEQALAYHIYTEHNGDYADAPGVSWHEFRLAVDVQTYIIRRLTNAMLEPFGLVKAQPDNSTHIQPIETMRVADADKAGFAGMANAGFTFASEALIVQTVKCPFCGKVY